MDINVDICVETAVDNSGRRKLLEWSAGTVDGAARAVVLLLFPRCLFLSLSRTGDAPSTRMLIPLPFRGTSRLPDVVALLW